MDNLYQGQSTFMVEMIETATIMNNASSNSLIILDEIGRGTSTFDGISIAAAVSEYIHDEIGARTLFATHYHELTSLEDNLSGVVNYSMKISEIDDQLVFQYQLVREPADKSYGVHVAEMAGMPSKVIKRAKGYLKKLESQEIGIHGKAHVNQLQLF